MILRASIVGPLLLVSSVLRTNTSQFTLDLSILLVMDIWTADSLGYAVELL